MAARHLKPCAGSNTPMLQIQDVTFSHPDHPVITGLSASIKPGVTFVRGGDGRGKTTLIRLLAGDLQPAGGRIEVDGVNLQVQPASYRAHVFWIDPRSEAFDQLTANEFFEAQQGLFPTFDASLVPALVQGLDLGLHIGKKLFMLSTGSKRKVWVAAAFACRASVALLDMPFAAVDKVSSDFIVTLLQQVASFPDRSIVFTGYEMPGDIPLAGTIDLGE